MLTNIKKIKSINRLFSVGFKKYKKQLFIITILGFLSGLFAGIGIGAIIPLFFSVTGQTPEEINFISRIIENFFNFLNMPFTPLFLILFIVILFTLKGAVNFSAKYINNKIVSQFGEETRNDLVGKTFRSSWPHLLNQKIGHLEIILLRDVTISTSLLYLISSLILVLTSFLMYASVALADATLSDSASTLLATALIFGHPAISVVTPQVRETMKRETGFTSHPLVEMGLAREVAEPCNLTEYMSQPDSELVRQYLRPYEAQKALQAIEAL